jgi:hypothetical protein
VPATARTATTRRGGVTMTSPVPTTAPDRTPATRADGSPCVSADLAVVPMSSRPSGSTQVETFRLTNTGPTLCTIFGYPKMVPYRASTSVQASVVPIPAGEGAIGAGATRVLLGPGESAVFHVQWSPTPNGANDCQTADGIVFSAPGESSLVRVPFAFRFCGRAIRQSVIQPA